MLRQACTALALAGLLAACAGEPATAPLPTTTVSGQPPAPSPPPPLPPHLRELSGRLLGVPAGADVELALLRVDGRGLPQSTLGSTQLRGDGKPLAFQLRFDPTGFTQGARIELRGRVLQAGRLILSLPPRAIGQSGSQALGELHLAPAP